jgi:hypothetical protein
MQNLMTRDLASTFVADAERRWLYGHPYRAERPRRARAAARRAARSARGGGRFARVRTA